MNCELVCVTRSDFQKRRCFHSNGYSEFGWPFTRYTCAHTTFLLSQGHHKKVCPRVEAIRRQCTMKNVIWPAVSSVQPVKKAAPRRPVGRNGGSLGDRPWRAADDNSQ